MNAELIQDEAVILEVRNWQTADKYAVCFCRDHGKIPFIAYGAAYPKSVSGRLVQPFAHVRLSLARGRRVAALKSCEFVEIPRTPDVEVMAYGSIISEAADQRSLSRGSLSFWSRPTDCFMSGTSALWRTVRL